VRVVERAVRLAVCELEQLHPRLVRKLVRGVTAADRAPRRRVPLGAGAHEPRVGQQPHPARVVDVQVGHHHELDVPGLDAARAKL
jgi:hypothetical protein